MHGTGLRVHVHELLQGEGDTWSIRVVNGAIVAAIFASILALLLETMEPVRDAYGPALRLVEALAVGLFSVEYLARVWSVPEDPRFRGAVTGRLKWMGTPLAVVDILAIAPFFLPVLTESLVILRMARVLRIVRILKMGRYSRAVQTLDQVVGERRGDLVVALALSLSLLLVASTLMFYVEHEAQPEAFASIPAAMWWGITTLTTVGYGDVTPVTPAGRVLGAIVQILGIGLFALPAGIIASGFSRALERQREAQSVAFGRCPHCGERLPDPAEALPWRGRGRGERREEGRQP